MPQRKSPAAKAGDFFTRHQWQEHDDHRLYDWCVMAIGALAILFSIAVIALGG